MTAFADVPEQPEAKRLLDAALAEGPAHAYLFHGPAGRRQAGRCARIRWRAARRPAPRRRSHASRPPGDRGARRHDPDRRDPRAPPRPPHAAVRGGSPRLPHLRRAPHERRGRGRAPQGPRGAARLRDARPRRGRARAASGDDPVALPARPVPPSLRRRRRGLDRGAGARASTGRGRRRSHGSPAAGSTAPRGCSTTTRARGAPHCSTPRARRIATTRSTRATRRP